MEKSKINQAQGPRTGNTGNMDKVKNFHKKHSYADMLAGSVARQFGTGRPAGKVTPDRDKMNGIEPKSRDVKQAMPKTTGKR